MAKEYKTLAGVEPEDAADVSIRLKVLAGELYTVLCAAESLKLNCFPQTAAGEALDLHAEERGLVRKDAVKSVGTLTFSRRTALSYAAEIPAGTVCAASGENAVEYETTEAAVLPAGALTVTAAAPAGFVGGAGAPRAERGDGRLRQGLAHIEEGGAAEARRVATTKVDFSTMKVEA